jgi:hypothetical protein
MPRRQYKTYVWTKADDDKLLDGIRAGKTFVQLEVYLKVGEFVIKKRLHEMGFEGLLDARHVLTDKMLA